MSKRALIAGISSYTVDPLAFCVDDAKSIATVLQMREYGFATTIITDEEVTTSRLKEELERLLAEGDEAALFYFAGHGAVTDYGAYLVTHDHGTRLDNSLDLHFLSRMLNARSSPQAAVITILDCCHSGSFHLGPSITVALRASDLLHAVQLASERRVLLAACRDNQFADEDSTLQHGIFTSSLLEGLTGEAAGPSGEVTVGALYEYVAEAFVTHKVQTPVYRGDVSGRIVLGRGLAPKARRERTQELVLIEREARAHLRSIHEVLVPSMGNREEWQTTGHLTACKLTTPILDWFEKREREHPRIQKNIRISFAVSYTPLSLHEAYKRTTRRSRPGVHVRQVGP